MKRGSMAAALTVVCPNCGAPVGTPCLSAVNVHDVDRTYKSDVVCSDRWNLGAVQSPVAPVEPEKGTQG